MFFKKFFFLLDNDYKSLPLFSILIFIATIFELLSLSALGVLISILIGDELEGSKLSFIYNFFQNFFDRNLSSKGFCIILLLFWLLKTISIILINTLTINYSYKKELNLKFTILKSLTKIDYLNFINHQSSFYVNIYNRFPSIFRTFFKNLIQFISDFTIAIAVILFLIYLNPFITIILIIVNIVFILFFYNFFLKKLKSYGKISNYGFQKSTQYLQELFRGFKEIKILNKEIFFEKKLIDGANSIVRGDSRIQIYNFLSRPILELIYVFLITMGIIFLISSNSDITSYFPLISIFVVSGIRLLPYINKFNLFFGSIKSSQDAIENLYKYLINQINNNVEYEDIFNYGSFNKVIFNNVSFKYPNGKKIFDKINLEINKNSFIGIVGKSGTGKTTLIDLLLGIVKPDSGKVFINNFLVKDNVHYYLRNWQDKICYLPQDIFITDDTLFSNITLDHNKIEIKEQKEKVINSLKKVNLFHWYQNLDLGLDTILGENGQFISGGQKQRIALARAFYFNKEIIIMDESTNSLDKENEKIIIEEIKKISLEKTIIFISHKVELLKKCNKVFEVSNNNLIEYDFKKN